MYLDRNKDFSIKALRFTMAIIFLWFGFLKLLNISPVFDVIAQSYPFITTHHAAYLGLAILEIVLGIGILVPRFVRWVGWVMVGHLTAATAGVLFSPQAFVGGFPALSIVGEFVVKNFVLIAAALTVASHEDS